MNDTVYDLWGELAQEMFEILNEEQTLADASWKHESDPGFINPGEWMRRNIQVLEKRRQLLERRRQLLEKVKS